MASFSSHGLRYKLVNYKQKSQWSSVSSSLLWTDKPNKIKARTGHIHSKVVGLSAILYNLAFIIYSLRVLHHICQFNSSPGPSYLSLTPGSPPAKKKYSIPVYLFMFKLIKTNLWEIDL